MYFLWQASSVCQGPSLAELVAVPEFSQLSRPFSRQRVVSSRPCWPLLQKPPPSWPRWGAAAPEQRLPADEFRHVSPERRNPGKLHVVNPRINHHPSLKSLLVNGWYKPSPNGWFMDYGVGLPTLSHLSAHGRVTTCHNAPPGHRFHCSKVGFLGLLFPWSPGSVPWKPGFTSWGHRTLVNLIEISMIIDV